MKDLKEGAEVEVEEMRIQVFKTSREKKRKKKKPMRGTEDTE